MKKGHLKVWGFFAKFPREVKADDDLCWVCFWKFWVFLNANE